MMIIIISTTWGTRWVPQWTRKPLATLGRGSTSWGTLWRLDKIYYLVSLPIQLQDDEKDGKKKVKRRQGKCIDTIIDGSLMGAVLAVCLAMVIGASFFAYKNLYFAVMKKWYPEAYKAPWGGHEGNNKWSHECYCAKKNVISEKEKYPSFLLSACVIDKLYITNIQLSFKSSPL